MDYLLSGCLVPLIVMSVSLSVTKDHMVLGGTVFAMVIYSCGLMMVCRVPSFYSLSLFFVHIGGVFVLFAYVISVVSNPKFEDMGKLGAVLSVLNWMLAGVFSLLFALGTPGVSCVSVSAMKGASLKSSTPTISLLSQYGVPLFVVGAVLLISLVVVSQLCFTRGRSGPLCPFSGLGPKFSS